MSVIRCQIEYTKLYYGNLSLFLFLCLSVFLSVCRSEFFSIATCLYY